MKIALSIIARDRADTVVRLLDSTKGVFDFYCLQDTGSKDNSMIEAWQNWCKSHSKPFLTDRKEMGKDYDYVEVNGVKLLGDFGKARNDSFDLAKRCGADYVMWIDSDDIILGAEKIRQAVDFMEKNGCQVGLMTYIYAKGAGNIKPVVQRRERIMDIRVPGKWIDMVHENYLVEGVAKTVFIEDIEVQHERTVEDVVETGRRNNLIMKRQLEKEGIDNFSDKMLHNLAFDHWEHKEYEESIKYYKIFVKRNKNNQAVLFDVYLRLARAYFEQGKLEVALKYTNKATSLNRGSAEPAILSAEIYSKMNMIDDSNFYAQKVLAIGKPDTVAPINEYDFVVKPRIILVENALKSNNFEQAIKYAKEIYETTGNYGALAEYKRILDDYEKGKMISSYAGIVRHYQGINDYKSMKWVKKSIPKELLENPTMRKLISEIDSDYYRKVYPPRLNGIKTIVFYAGDQAIESWDGESDITKGIGGSEGMCIQMARELSAIGNKVFVFNKCGASDGKVFDGVTYYSFEKFNPDLKCDVLISLRRPDIFMKRLSAKKQYLWLHDTNYEDSLPQISFTSPNNVFILSDAHRDSIKQAHFIKNDDIFWKTRNGLNKYAVEYADKNAGERNPYQIIWASSYDRGLDFVLENWSKIKTAIPQATLKVFYGWNTYDALMNARKSQEMFNYKQKMLELLKQDGVEELGRVSQNELYKQFAESSIWFYPTAFYEISCINAMSSQAMGCIPVCTPFAALNETVGDYGIKLDRKYIVDGLIEYMKDIDKLEKRRKPMQEWARNKYSMSELAKEWDKFFNTGK